MSETKKKTKKKKLSKTGRLILDVILIAALCMAGYSGYRLYQGLHDYEVAKNEYDDLRKAVVTTVQSEDVEEEDHRRAIDWTKLRQINSDIAGWLSLEDSTIDYPIVRSSDNEYYLKHLIDGRTSNAGTLFIDMNNTPDFSDRNTIVYGHHMLSDPKMFAELENYTSQEYYDTHKTMLLETPDINYEVQVIAGIETTGTGGYIRQYFSSDEDYLNYINTTFLQNSTFVSEATITAADRMVLFSTCSYEVNDGRYVLIGKLVPIVKEEEKTEEPVSEPEPVEQPVIDDGSIGSATVTVEAIYIWYGPGEEYEIAGEAYQDETYKVYEHIDMYGNQWYRISENTWIEDGFGEFLVYSANES